MQGLKFPHYHIDSGAFLFVNTTGLPTFVLYCPYVAVMDRLKQKLKVFRTADHESDEDEGVEYAEESIEKRKPRFEDDENESGSKKMHTQHT